jgi:hypothetical protein
MVNRNHVDIVALSADCYEPRLRQGLAACGPRANGYADFRRLLDDKNVQAVVVSTPDHDSEYLGASVDTGNNVALLDRPMYLVEALAPYAITTTSKMWLLKSTRMVLRFRKFLWARAF